ncbi:23S rRNA (guanosine(2251)-2'-O)-methyltransferase RlmB [Tepidamorphus sp. 3E244]|uniref:23S rRNA (guanosine(2251)-2'-O)-methyltransferase RlmB n=1 Tax=Tepidamorphus sp. 3E244 TaxID=3385498 RepID=UPI0038FBEAD9
MNRPDHKRNARKGAPGGHRKPGGGNAPPAPPERLSLYGLHTVEAALGNPQRKLFELHASANALRKLGDAVPAGLEVIETHPRELDRHFGKDTVHQGVRLDCAPIPDMALDDFLFGPKTKAARLLVLDQITDPHNVGAILRSAAAFAVDAIVTTARHSPVESAVLAKSASGALEYVPFIRERNLADAMARLAENGVRLIGLDSEGETDLETVTGASPYALVLGAEGKGLRQRTREHCTVLARLDMPGAIKSLNVSNAAALALYAARRGESS